MVVQFYLDSITIEELKKKLQVSVADPGFPKKGRHPKELTTYYFDPILLKTA